MKRGQWNTRRGFSLVEAVLASSLFVMLLTAMVGGFIYSKETAFLSGARSRAAKVAEEGLEAVRNIRDENFTNLANGVHGLAIVGNIWTFSGLEDQVDIFTRQIEIGDDGTNRKKVTATVTWKQNNQRNGTVVLTTRLTNWEAPKPSTCENQADWLSVDSSTANLGAGNRELRRVFVQNIAIDCDIILDKVVVTWTNSGRKINRVWLSGTIIWSGLEVSGSLLDVTNSTLLPQAPAKESRYRFNGNMSGDTFTITFIMSDGTQKVDGPITP